MRPNLASNLTSPGRIAVAEPYRKRCMHSQQKRTKTTTPAQKIHLSSRALRSIMRIVSPEMPSVLATE